MTVLVTGAGGWLGSTLVARIAREGKVEVHGLDRADLDCADEHRTEEVLAAIRPTTVVHMAASLARGEDREATEAQWRDSFVAGRNVVQAARRLGIPHLVVPGTMDELGDHAGVLTPDLAPRPLTTYGLCKSLVREVACFETRHAPLRVDWFRPTTIYGPGQRGPMLVPAACRAARDGRPTSFTAGTQSRDFLFVDDLVEWLLLAVGPRVGESGVPGLRLHHLGTGVGVQVRDVLALIASQMPAARFDIGALPRREHEPPLQVAPPYTSDDATLGSWRPRTSWRDGILQTIAWWRSLEDDATAVAAGGPGLR